MIIPSASVQAAGKRGHLHEDISVESNTFGSVEDFIKYLKQQDNVLP